MRVIIFLITILIFFKHGLLSQELSTLLKEDFNRQSLLLIKNEIRKALGEKANSKEVQGILINLLPWSRMEELTSQQFARAVILLYESEKAGISFVNNEELLPLVANFKGSNEEFLILSRFMKEAEDSKLPLLYRDELISRGLDRKWNALSILLAGRLLILSRNEDFETSLFFAKLLNEIPRSVSNMSDQDIQRLINRLTDNFKHPQNIKNLQIIQNDILSIKSSKKSQLAFVLSNKSRNLNTVFEDYGKMEIRRRPPAFIDEILPTENSFILNSNQETSSAQYSGNNLLKENWKTLNKNNYNNVVRSWLGTKYKFGGNSRQGVDCSGFTFNVLVDPAINVPRNFIPRRAIQQSEIGSNVSNQNMQPGDLVFFSASPNRNKITHVGLFMGNRSFSHASSSRGVVIQSLDSKWWKERYVSSRKIFQYVK